MRLTLEDVILTGGVIPANSMVIGLISAANRDPRKYADADDFNIFRQDLDVNRAFTGAANHLAFGGGKHFCIGTKLAREEVIIATNLLLDNLPNMQFANDEPEEYGFFARGLKNLHLKFTPRRDAI